MSDIVGPTLAIAGRNLRVAFTNPPLLLPPLIAPIVFYASFAGGLSAVDSAPGFDFPPGYAAFQLVFVMLQAAGFNGVFAGLALAREFESGFVRRLFLAVADRRAVVFGYLVSALVRAAVSVAVLFAVALAFRTRLDGSPAQLFLLAVLAVLFCAIGMLWGAGVVLRIRSMRAAPLLQMPFFLTLFLAPTFVPLALLDGWLRTVADVNPVTRLLEAGRSLVAGRPDGVGVAFAVTAACILGGLVWGITGLRRAERSA